MSKIPTDIALEELSLNIIHQNIKVDTFAQVGYEFEKGKSVFMLCFPKKLLGGSV